MKTSYPKLHSYKLKNTENVIELNVMTTETIDPQKVLMGAINERLDNVVVLGFDQDGDFFFATSHADGGNALWLMELAKTRLMGL